MPQQRFRWVLPPQEELWTARGALTGVQLLALSFLGLIVLGSLGFLILPGLYTGPHLSFVDAVFTATSAVCVTGLTVVDTATHFTVLGQIWIALLIQLGGLGILTLATQIIAVMGRRNTLMMEHAVGSLAGGWETFDAKQIVRSVVVFTFGVEVFGMVLLWFLWKAQFGSLGAVWPAVFHSISAFCNAGFSVFSDSLVGFQRRPGTLAVIALLVVLGGVGFIVVDDLWVRYVKRTTQRLRAHTKLALGATAVLLVIGTLLYLTYESGNALAELAWSDRLANALFMSVSARTAGFNTVDYANVSNATVLLTLILMLVGGSPGSTAGGIKTTTFALLVITLVSRLRGLGHVSVLHRTVPDETIHRATSLAVASGALVGCVILLLLMLELPLQVADRKHFVQLVFEAHSAFGTVGLSMGKTADLTKTGEWLLVVLMFLGRVGPLTLAAAMASARGRRAQYRYSREDVVIG